MTSKPNFALWAFEIALFLAAILLLQCTTRAQETQLGVLGSLSPSSGAGYGTAYGVAGHGAASLLNDRVAVVGTVGVESAPKIYVGDGSRTFGRVEARYYWAGQPKHETGKLLRFFASGGANFTRADTSQYSKQAVNGLLGGGVNWDQKFITRYHYILKEHQTQNEVSGQRVGFDAYVPVATGADWRWLASVEYQRWRFYQPTGPAKGEHTAQSFVLAIGISRRVSK